MPHFRTQLDPVRITITSAALGEDVYPSLKMARAALEAAIHDEIAGTIGDMEKGILALQHAAKERIRDLRAARAAALKVRESDLPIESDSGKD